MTKIKFVIPDSDRAGLFLVLKIIKHVSNDRLLGIEALITKYEDSPEKQKIKEMLDNEYKKRNIKH